MADRIQQRRDTAARWEQFNPILLEGEVGYVTDDPNQYKIGDGVRAWNDLPIRGFDGTVAQNLGNSTTAVMSQKAVTEPINKLLNLIDVINPQTLNSFNKINPNELNLGKSISPVNGTDIVTTTNFNTKFIDVGGLSKVYSQIYANGSMYAYDEDFAFISAVPHSETEYALPKNTRYIRLAGNQSLIGGNSLYLYIEEETTYYAYGITRDSVYTDTQILEVETKIEKVKDIIDIRETNNQFINKINYVTDFLDGILINVSGQEQSLATACASVFIDVLGLEKFYTGAYAYGSVYGYDEELNFVKVLPSSAGGFSGAYLVEDGIRYVRISIISKNNKNKIFFYAREEDLSVKINIYNAYYYEYGITYTDVKQQSEIDVIPTKIDRFDIRYHNFINIFSEDIIAKKGALLNTSDGYSEITTVPTQSYSHFIPVIAGNILCSNISSYGSILKYDKEKNYIGVIGNWKTDARFKNNIRYVIIEDDVAFLRFSGPNQYYNLYHLSISDVFVTQYFDYGKSFDTHFKYGGKKLVTIGDSITYQRTWQDRLCELTGLWHNPKEVRGANEGVKTEGYGYILLTAENEDTDTYYEEVEGITKSDETVIDGFGYAHPIWTDAEGNRYRQPCRTAEGGETVMPVNTTSIYSRASDSKYYKGDVIIVFGGANDKVAYINKYPTHGDLSNIQGLTNLKDETEDTTEATFEIYTEDAVLTSDGDYSDVEEVTGIKKYNHTFRACFRGLLKKVVDANPDAQIIVIGPFATLIKTNDYISRGYDYLTIEENKVIEECAREFSCQYINLYPLFGRYGADKYFKATDGTVYIHPTEEGGRKIAEYIASMIM